MLLYILLNIIPYIDDAQTFFYLLQTNKYVYNIAKMFTHMKKDQLAVKREYIDKYRFYLYSFYELPCKHRCLYHGKWRKYELCYNKKRNIIYYVNFRNDDKNIPIYDGEFLSCKFKSLTHSYIYNSYFNNEYECEHTINVTVSNVIITPHDIWPSTTFSSNANVFTIEHGCFKGKRYLITEKLVMSDKSYMPHIPIDKKLKYMKQYDVVSSIIDIITGPRQTSVQVINHPNNSFYQHFEMFPHNSKFNRDIDKSISVDPIVEKKPCYEICECIAEPLYYSNIKSQSLILDKISTEGKPINRNMSLSDRFGRYDDPVIDTDVGFVNDITAYVKNDLDANEEYI